MGVFHPHFQHKIKILLALKTAWSELVQKRVLNMTDNLITRWQLNSLVITLQLSYCAMHLSVGPCIENIFDDFIFGPVSPPDQFE